MVVALAVAVCLPTSTTATGESATVTGAAGATFTQAASFASVSLQSLELGTGVFIESDGTASGVYSAVLTGKSLLGQAQQITIDGRVLRGEMHSDGRAYFSGTATVNLGNGTPSLPSVPFSVSATGDSISLTIGSTTLPVAQVNSGNVSVE